MEKFKQSFNLPKNCPDCGKSLEEFFQKNRKFLGCSGFPNCRFTLDVLNYTESLSIKEKNGKIRYPSNCPLCGDKLAIYIGKYGPFFGCNGYPECKFSLNFEDLNNISCPMCGNSMKERTGKYGVFLGCNSFPNCRSTYNIRAIKDKKSIEKTKHTKKKPMKKKLVIGEVVEMETHDYNRILETLTDKWQDIHEICQKLDITDEYDIRFLQIRLKYFENKGMIRIIKKNRERYYSLFK